MVQDGLGVLLAKLLGLHPFLGLVAGSITLVGGHGTGAAYVEKFGEASAIPGVMALTMTSATLGLVLGGVIGGPVAERLIRRHRLSAVAANGADSDVIMGPAETPVTTVPLVGSLAAALVAVLIGQWLGRLLADAPVTVPDFLLSLLAGLVLRNAGELVGLRLHDAAPDLIGSVCLSLFLAWTMMALDLGTVFGLAGPLLIILAAQVVLVALWASLVTFRVVGRDYESAVMAAAFCGFAMGATATAIANMQALARRHGPPPRSGAAGLPHHPDRRRLLHRHHQCGRADAVSVARHDGVRVAGTRRNRWRGLGRWRRRLPRHRTKPREKLRILMISSRRQATSKRTPETDRPPDKNQFSGGLRIVPPAVV